MHHSLSVLYVKTVQRKQEVNVELNRQTQLFLRFLKSLFHIIHIHVFKLS